MSIGFNWFKNWKITKEEYRIGELEYEIEFLDGGDTSHSAGNITKLQDILLKYGDVEIPTIWSKVTNTEAELINELIEPREMLEACNNALRHTSEDIEYMRDRLEWIRDLSKDGYYICYDYE